MNPHDELKLAKAELTEMRWMLEHARTIAAMPDDEQRRYSEWVLYGLRHAQYLLTRDKLSSPRLNDEIQNMVEALK